MKLKEDRDRNYFLNMQVASKKKTFYNGSVVRIGQNIGL